VTYFRATDPFPLESAEFTKLHEFYTRLGQGRLSTTRCTGCGRTAWPPRGFCAECGGDAFGCIDLRAAPRWRFGPEREAIVRAARHWAEEWPSIHCC